MNNITVKVFGSLIMTFLIQEHKKITPIVASIKRLNKLVKLFLCFFFCNRMFSFVEFPSVKSGSLHLHLHESY